MARSPAYSSETLNGRATTPVSSRAWDGMRGQSGFSKNALLDCVFAKLWK
jgi:hypothetical protein